MNEPPTPACMMRSVRAGAAFAVAAPCARGATWLVMAVLFVLLLPGCRPIRPVEKIGLLAPFEGLQRRTGYAALEAVRAALTASPRAPVDRLPLALDTSRDPARSARKLLADSAVQAVIGPFSLTEASAVQGVLTDAKIPWLAPFAIDAEGAFAPVGQPERWAQPWLGAIAQTARRQGYSRLVVAGWPAVWSQVALESATGHPALIVLSDDPATVQSTDAVLHVGDAATVASYLHTLRTHEPNAPLYLGPQGEDPVLVEQSEIIHEVYWMTWLDDGYEAWASEHRLESPFRYLVYRATATALRAANGESPTDALRIQWYAYDETGLWRAVAAPGALR